MLFPNVRIVGIAFRDALAKEVASTLDAGDKISLVPDPENEYDSNAIKVYFSGTWIGFIERDQAAWIAPAMEENPERVFSGVVTGIVSGAKTYYPIVDISDGE